MEKCLELYQAMRHSRCITLDILLPCLAPFKLLEAPKQFLRYFSNHYTLSLSLSLLLGFIGYYNLVLNLQARSSQSNKLELFFRPEDPYSHPTFGELRACSNLLLKISKKKSSSSINSPNSANKSEAESCVETEVCADIVARIPEAYHFDG